MSNNDIKEFVNQSISITELSRNPGKVLNSVVEDHKNCIIIRNNRHEAVIISIQEYLELLDIKNKYENENKSK